MVLYSELVCLGCQKILTHALGALSCRCSHCGSITPAQHMSFPCAGCSKTLVAPRNTLEALCPVCATVTNIPIEFLPRVPTPEPEANGRAEEEEGGSSGKVSMYVRAPASRTGDGKEVPQSLSVATRIF